MEVDSDLAAMTVNELRAHLARQGVSLTDIAVEAGSGPPRKRDLQRHAQAVRQAEPQPLSPNNPFQQRSTPPRPPAPAVPAPAPTPASAPRPRTPARRRSWIDRTLLDAMQAPTPARHDPPPASAARAPRPQPPRAGEEAWERTPRANRADRTDREESPQPSPAKPVLLIDGLRMVGAEEESRHRAPVGYAAEVEEDIRFMAAPSDGDEVVNTDSDGMALSQSGVSDADSTFLTDEDDVGETPQFDMWRVQELKDYLSSHKIPYVVKSRKATLVSMARAHANHLATLASSQPAQAPAAVLVEDPADDAADAVLASTLGSARTVQRSRVTRDSAGYGFPAGNSQLADEPRVVEVQQVPEAPQVPTRARQDNQQTARAPQAIIVVPSARDGRVVNLDSDVSGFDDGDQADDEGVLRRVPRKQGASSSRRSRVRDVSEVDSQPPRRKIAAPEMSEERRTPVVDVDAIQPAPAAPPTRVRGRPRKRPARAPAASAQPVQSLRQEQAAWKNPPAQLAVAAARRSESKAKLGGNARAGYNHRFADRRPARWQPRLPKIAFPKISLPRLPRPSLRQCGVGLVSIFLLGFVALLVHYGVVVYKYSQRPFCDNFMEESVLANGEPCRPCPDKALCRDGDFTCEVGFARFDSRCLPDQEVSLYADHLVTQSRTLLRDLAGRKACGEDDLNIELTSDDIYNQLAPQPPSSESEASETGPRIRRFRSRNRFDESKFSDAFLLAETSLHEGKVSGVVQDENGKFAAAEPALPLGCALRLYLMNHIQKLFFAFVLFCVVVRWKFRQIRNLKYAELLRETCDEAREVLIEQMRFYREGANDRKFVIDTHLRAEILGDSPTAVQIWKDAEKQLERDTRVEKIGPTTVEGHPCYIWQWRGRDLQGSNFGSGSRRSSGMGSRRASSDSVGTGSPFAPRLSFG